jgi:hypothetical protein
MSLGSEQRLLLLSASVFKTLFNPNNSDGTSVRPTFDN